MFTSVCLQANQPKSRRQERGCDLAEQQLLRNSWFTFQFSMALPRSPHACLPACLPGLLETRCYWTKAAAPQRHTQQLLSVATYHLMTLREGKATHDCNTSSLRGNNSSLPRQKKLATIHTPYTKKEIENSKFKCACTETSAEQWMGDVSHPKTGCIAQGHKHTVNKERRKHGGSSFRCLKAFQEKIFPVISTELMNFH